MKKFKIKPICNNNPCSAPCINGKAFILCWRCTSAIIGAAISFTFLFFVAPNYTDSLLIFAAIFATPAIVDFTLTKTKIIKPSNFRRIISGLILGIAVSLAVYFFSNILFDFAVPL